MSGGLRITRRYRARDWHIGARPVTLGRDGASAPESNRSKTMTRITLTAAALTLSLAALPAGAQARPSLGEVDAIHQGLLAVGIADEIRKVCDDIDARMITAFAYLSSLKGEARDMGYSDEEIDDYVTSKAEKRKYRAEGEAWLTSRGVTLGEADGYCRVGRDEIRKGTQIGVLLRAK